MMAPSRVTYPWKTLFWLWLMLTGLVLLVSFCYAQTPAVPLPGTMPNHGHSGLVGGPAMVIPPTGSPTFLYPVAPAPTPAPVAPAPVTIIPPAGLPTFVYPWVVR